MLEDSHSGTRDATDSEGDDGESGATPAPHVTIGASEVARALQVGATAGQTQASWSRRHAGHNKQAPSHSATHVDGTASDPLGGWRPSHLLGRPCQWRRRRGGRGGGASKGRENPNASLSQSYRTSGPHPRFRQQPLRFGGGGGDSDREREREGAEGRRREKAEGRRDDGQCGSWNPAQNSHDRHRPQEQTAAMAKERQQA
jgi:hypothetical protein